MKVADTIECKPRQAGNKSVARKLRASGQAPAVMYGPGTAESQFLAVDPKMFLAQRQQFGESHLFQVKVDGGTTCKALIKSVDRDPVTSQLLHVDFYAVDMNKAIRVEVRLELEGKPKGLVDGGLLTQIMRTLEVQCLPGAIPEKLVLDVSAMDIGDTLHMSDIKMPADVKLTAQHDEAVAAVVAPEAVKEETPAAEAAAAPGAAGAAPAAGAGAPAGGSAPAAGAAAPAAKGEKKDKK